MSEREPLWLDDPRGAATMRSGTQPNGHDPTPALAPIDPSTLQDVPIPPRQWLVPDWIPMARATSLYGGGGEGKTLLAQMLATACAVGGHWLGLPARQCNSLLLYAEDDLDEMQRRQADINAAYGCSFSDLSAMRWLPRLGEDNALMALDGGRLRHTRLFAELAAIAEAHDVQLIVVDTLADIFTGNENDRGQARAFAQAALGALARQTGGAVLALAHPSLTGSANGSTGSGSTAWKGTFRSQLYLESPASGEGEQSDPDLRAMRRAKANYARRDESIEIRWRAGVFEPTRPVTTGIIASIERRTAERVFMDLLGKVTAEGRFVSDSHQSPQYAARVFSMRPDRERFTKKDFEGAMQRLFAAKEIQIGVHRTPDRKVRNCILPAAAAGAPTAPSGGLSG